MITAGAALIGCGWFEDEPGANDTDLSIAEQRENIWGKRETPDLAARRERAAAREPAAMAAEAGDVEITITIDRRATTHSVEMVHGAFRVADLATLEYPQGHVLFDVASFTSDDAAWSTPIIELVLSPGGEPSQLFFDLQTIGKLDGDLSEVTGTATAVVHGFVQLGGYQAPVLFDARFTRTGPGRLTVDTVEPVEIVLGAFRRDEEIDAARRAMKVRRIGPTVHVTASFALQESPTGLLPNFVRAPISVKTVDDIREAMEDDIDRVGITLEEVNRASVPRALRSDTLDRAKMQQLQKNIDLVRRGKKTPSEIAREGRQEEVLEENNGVIIRLGTRVVGADPQ